MNNLKQYINTSFLVGIIFFLFIPLIQNTFQLKKHIKPLKGAFNAVPDTSFSTSGWFSGRFQEIKNDYLNQNFGLRNYYVRLNNQIDYDLFNLANVDKVVKGKGNFLFESNYIDAYYGNNFIGKEELLNRVNKLKELQTLLASNNIDLEILLLPSKASFFPEFIPDNWVYEKKLNNYEYMVELFKKVKVKHIDYSAWFRDLKNTTPYDLYPQTGIHWSNYGALIATDSLRKNIEHNVNLNLKEFVINNIAISDSLIDPDKDIEDAMNLFSPINKLPMPYASYYWKEEENITMPKALFIGDSYFWNIYYQGLTVNMFTDCKFWYYNQTVYPENESIREVTKLNFSEEVKKQRIIVLMATESNIHDIGWGFVDKALAEFKSSVGKGDCGLNRELYIKVISEQIKQNAQWMNDIKRKATENKVSIDEMVKLDAMYVFETDYCKPDVVSQINETKDKIKNTPEWMAQITIKAKKNKISIDEMIDLDAKYVYDTKLKNK